MLSCGWGFLNVLSIGLEVRRLGKLLTSLIYPIFQQSTYNLSTKINDIYKVNHAYVSERWHDTFETTD
jgi:hypothetical protein